MNKLKIGLIGRADATGLGQMTREFCRHNARLLDRTAIVLRDKPLVGEIEAQRLDVYREGFGPESLRRFVDGLDAVIGFETFYCDDAIATLERAGVKAVMFPMWECSPPDAHAAHLLISLSEQDARTYPESRHLDWPVNPVTFHAALTWPHVRSFWHHAGFGGLNGRNNTAATILAAESFHELTKQPIHVRAMKPLGYRPGVVFHPSLELTELLWSQGLGVLIHLQAHPGLSLPLLEAACCQIPAMVLDLDENQHYPEHQRVRVADWELGSIGGQTIPYGRPCVPDLVEKMCAIYHGDVQPSPVPPPPSWEAFNKRFWPLLERLCSKSNPSTCDADE